MSYVLLDMDRMVVTHKHPSRVVLSAVSWIESANKMGLYPVTERGLADLTDLELRMLYKNSTGENLTAYGNHMHQLVVDMLVRMPDSDIDPQEAHDQAKWLKREDRGDYSYARGASEPRQTAGLLPIIKVSVNAEAVANLQFVATVPVTAKPEPAFGGSAAFSQPANTQAAPRAPRAPSAPSSIGKGPGRGATAAIIFQVADEFWEKAGKPTDKPTIMKLRKEMMQELETEHGVKRNTSSNTLGDWQKVRVPS